MKTVLLMLQKFITLMRQQGVRRALKGAIHILAVETMPSANVGLMPGLILIPAASSGLNNMISERKKKKLRFDINPHR